MTDVTPITEAQADEIAKGLSGTSTETAPAPETKMPITIQKSATRNIRKTVFAWFRTMSESQIKALKFDEFLAKVLTIDPNWPIAAKGKKQISVHLSWYRTNFKKLAPDQRVTQPEPVPVAASEAPAPQPQA